MVCMSVHDRVPGYTCQCMYQGTMDPMVQEALHQIIRIKASRPGSRDGRTYISLDTLYL
jgi:hypothetical protein